MRLNSIIPLIEDEALIRGVTSRLLQGAGYQIIEPDNGTVGLEKLKDTVPKLIIADQVEIAFF